ncbi:MAG: methylmalonyl Co-A mutase-associated GTPase MeaB [Gammaproteobacteria bacterium]
MNDTPAPPTDAAAWVARLLAGERRALSRCITWVENGTPEAPVVLGAIHHAPGHAQVVGITGPPGAGKSTLVSALIGEWRRRGLRIAVAAVDPSSPFSGGAILGDRIRMGDHTADDGVYIRSLASRGRVGGLSLATARVVDVLSAAGFDVVLVETVGAGQSEVEIAEVADTRIVVTPPGLGDDIQAAKAGILEIADILVVNKADLPGAEHAQAHLLQMAHLTARGGWQIPVLKTVATTGEGVGALVDAVNAHTAHIPARARGGTERTRRLLAGLAADALKTRLLGSADPRVEALCAAVARGERAFDAAVRELLDLGASNSA